MFQAPPNPDNPSMRSSFALGFLKVDADDDALRMADVTTATRLTTAYRGGLPRRVLLGGSVVLGVSHENANDYTGKIHRIAAFFRSRRSSSSDDQRRFAPDSVLTAVALSRSDATRLDSGQAPMP
jgi:hypothetical protein